MKRVVFDRFLDVTTRVARSFRVAVFRRVTVAPRGAPEIWSTAERAALRDAMRRMG